MSGPQRMVALALVVLAALMCLGMAGWQDRNSDRKQSLYTCTVWNDRAWAGCP
jgi:hypothetical protein